MVEITRSWNAKSIAKNLSERSSPNSTAPVVTGNVPPITGTTAGTRKPIVSPSCIVSTVRNSNETVSETRSGSLPEQRPRKVRRGRGQEERGHEEPEREEAARRDREDCDERDHQQLRERVQAVKETGARDVLHNLRHMTSSPPASESAARTPCSRQTIRSA